MLQHGEGELMVPDTIEKQSKDHYDEEDIRNSCEALQSVYETSHQQTHC